MHAALDPPSTPPLAQAVTIKKVTIKKDAASQTKCYRQLPRTNGRTVDCTQSSLSVCQDSRITAEKSLADYGVQFGETLWAGLRCSNKLIHSAASFAFRQVSESRQLPLVSPGIKQSLVFLTGMPALASAYPVSRATPICPGGVLGCNMTYGHSNEPNEGVASYHQSFAYPTTNLTTTSESTAVHGHPDPTGLYVIGGIAVCVGLVYGVAYCSDVYTSYKNLRHDNPNASCSQVIQAAFRNSGYTSQYRSPDDIIRLPVHSAPRTREVAAALTTGEQATQTNCEQGTQTEPLVNEIALQDQPPPTYAEATAAQQEMTKA